MNITDIHTQVLSNVTVHVPNDSEKQILLMLFVYVALFLFENYYDKNVHLCQMV